MNVALIALRGLHALAAEVWTRAVTRGAQPGPARDPTGRYLAVTIETEAHDSQRFPNPSTRSVGTEDDQPAFLDVSIIPKADLVPGELPRSFEILASRRVAAGLRILLRCDMLHDQRPMSKLLANQLSDSSEGTEYCPHR